MHKHEATIVRQHEHHYVLLADVELQYKSPVPGTDAWDILKAERQRHSNVSAEQLCANLSCRSQNFRYTRKVLQDLWQDIAGNFAIHTDTRRTSTHIPSSTALASSGAAAERIPITVSLSTLVVLLSHNFLDMFLCCPWSLVRLVPAVFVVSSLGTAFAS